MLYSNSIAEIHSYEIKLQRTNSIQNPYYVSM